MAHNECIEVSLRLRPLNSKEKSQREKSIWTISHNSVCIKPAVLDLLSEHRRISTACKRYSYNHCFGGSVSNRSIYRSVSSRLVRSCLEGFNCTLFVYGQTGSGKTHTMIGNSEWGLLQLSLEEMFSQRGFTLSCSYLEIYNEQIYDLLSDDLEPLSVFEDPVKGFYVKNLSEIPLPSFEVFLKYLEKGEGNRRYAATTMNHHSSRSHTLFRVFVNHASFESVMNFVDLAGSERASKHDLTEGKHINTSLFYLCQVINKLAEKSPHVPYRNSNLTKILRFSLGGNSLTSVICTATPTFKQFEMTLSTLRFGGTASTITNQVYKNDTKITKEAYFDKKQLEDRILKLTNLLFKQSKTSHKEDSFADSALWNGKAGDLLVDSRIVSQNRTAKYFVPKDQQLRYDEKGLLAIERMHSLKQELKAKEEELQEIRNCKGDILNPKMDVKEDLRKSISLCHSLVAKKKMYKNQARENAGKLETCMERLSVLENLKGVEHFSIENIDLLENFYLNALENVKKIKFMKKYPGEFAKIIEKQTSPPKQSIWEQLDIELMQTPKENEISFSQQVFTPGLSPIKILTESNL